MYLTNAILATLATSVRKGLEKRLRQDGQNTWRIAKDDTDTGDLVLQIMRDKELGWCEKHQLWHTIDLYKWRYREPFENCPSPPRTFGDYRPQATGEGKSDVEWGQLDAQGTEGESGESEGVGPEEMQRIEDYFEEQGQGGSEAEQQAKDAAQKDGTLPSKMKQQGKDEQKEPSASNQCPVTHAQYKCTLRKGHDGDHIAHWSDGTKAQRWKGKSKKKMEPKWKLRKYNRCPDCKIETLNNVRMPMPEPAIEDQLEYTERQCGCEALAQMGVA